MGYFELIIILVIAVVVGGGKISASANGERVCAFCRKRLKYAGAGHYAEVCPRCGRSQPRAAA